MGKIINGNYKILEVIGKGGMSCVYKAEHLRLGNVWAVKQVSKNQKAKFDFLAEANILKRLVHPMLPKIVDIFEDDEYLYVVEDFVEGENLEEILKRQKKFDEKTALVWFRQIAECLGYLHSQKPNPIIYRDMKPSNIMVQPNGDLKLIDFGIAREYKEDAKADTTYIGTKGYAAPEQAGKAQSDARTDIYSLGVTMYHIMSGKSPYEPPYSFVPIRQLNPKCSIGIEIILEKCIQQEPEDRYQNVIELINDLNNIYKYEEAYLKFSYKKRKRALLIVVMYLLSIGLVGTGFIFNSQERMTQFNSYLETAQKLIESNPSLALENLEKAQSISETDTTHLLIASAHYYAMDYDQCINYIENVMFKREGMQENISVLSLLASAYFEKEEYSKSIQYYELISSLSQDIDTNIMRDYAVTLAMNGNSDQATQILNDLLDKGIDQEIVQYINGSISYSLKQYSTAENCFQETISQSKSSTIKRKAIIALASMYRDAASETIENEYSIENARTKEIEFITRTMQTESMSNDATLWELLGEAYYNRAIYETNKDSNDLTQAAKAFQQILDLNIQKEYIYVNIFIAYQQAHDYNSALQILDEMERIYPDAYEPHAYRATLLIVIENEKFQQNRNYLPAYEEYKKASEKITTDDNDSQYVQLQGLIQQLKDGNWLN